jgi:predicted DNA-binding WGR domain protein
VSDEPHLPGKIQSGQKPAPVLSTVRDPGLFDDWSLVRERGRVGLPGTVRKAWFETKEEALTARQLLHNAKRKKGYQTRV